MPHSLSASSLRHTKVENTAGEKLGDIKDLMIDLDDGSIEYAVLSFGGVMGMGDKLFAVPWEALRVDTSDEKLVLPVDKEQLKNAPGFDKDHWPDFASPQFRTQISDYYRPHI